MKLFGNNNYLSKKENMQVIIHYTQHRKQIKSTLFHNLILIL